MKFFLFICIGLMFALTANAQVNPNNHYVEGYYKSNGTYVEGHYRTDPNSTINDNYSTYPNVNPYTGETGTVEPDYSTPNYNTSDYNTSNYSTPNYNTPNYSTPEYETPEYETPTYSTPKYKTRTRTYPY